jgi:hypothetical protein
MLPSSSAAAANYAVTFSTLHERFGKGVVESRLYVEPSPLNLNAIHAA